MIQRIQTLYLLLSLILMGLMGWLPFGELLVSDQVYNFTVNGIVNNVTGEKMQSGIAIMFLIGIVCIVQIAVIFGYKKRIRQMRMATFNIMLMLGVVGICYYFINASLKEFDDVTKSYNLTMIFPVIAAILNYLAIRSIGKDEALVRSIDRIR